MFQFLIGTIKTLYEDSPEPGQQKFQFLIGTIKTSSCWFGCSPLSPVSIPHRYDQNARRPTRLTLFMGVSIPHRYDQNKGVPCRHFHDITGFQFLIGTIKTQHQKRVFCGHLFVSIPHRYDQNAGEAERIARTERVSIPHRYDQNFYFRRKEWREVEFRFLIGTIKTRVWFPGGFLVFAFQFLIGTIKTNTATASSSYRPACFNSS